MAPTRPAAGGLAPLLALTQMEWRIGWRTAAFRLAVVVAAILGLSVGGEFGRGVALSAYSTADAACLYLGFGAIVWVAVAAVRETTLRTDIIVFSKPQPGELLALTKFLGAFLQLLAILAAMFAGAMVSRVFHGGLSGVGAYATQYVRTAVVIFFFATASYMMALLFDSALAGATIGLFWLLTLSGKAFLAKLYFPYYSQNMGAYVCLGLAFLFATLFLYRRSRRGAARPALWVRVGAPLFALLAALQFWAVITYGHDPEARQNPAMDRMAAQDTGVGRRAAGFLLPDQNGKLTGLSDFDGKILVIALWSPHDPDSVLLLDRLNDIEARYGPAGVQPVAVTICEDTGATSVFARGESLHYPVLVDWGSYNAPKGSDLSPLASAYRASDLPVLIITDRRRNVQAILTGIESYDGHQVISKIEERIAVEPR